MAKSRKVAVTGHISVATVVTLLPQSFISAQGDVVRVEDPLLILEMELKHDWAVKVRTAAPVVASHMGDRHALKRELLSPVPTAIRNFSYYLASRWVGRSW